MCCKQRGTDCTTILVIHFCPKHCQKKHHHSHSNQPLISCLSDSTWALGAAFLLISNYIFAKGTHAHWFFNPNCTGHKRICLPNECRASRQEKLARKFCRVRCASEHVNIGLPWFAVWFRHPIYWTPWIHKIVTRMHHSDLCNRYILQAINARFGLGGGNLTALF